MSEVGAQDTLLRTSEPPRFRLLERLRVLAGSREILANLVRKEVKVKYTDSVLGAAWSTLNPILYLLIFTLVFGVVLSNHVPNYAVYLLCGLIAWNFFSTSLALGARSVVDRANLVSKVYFPREILPLSSVGAALVDFGLQSAVLVGFMAVTRTFVFGVNLLLLPLALVALLALTTAVVMLVAGYNVVHRDTQHVVSLALLAWFWITPIVYPSGAMWARLADNVVLGVPLKAVYLANPMTPIVLGLQRALYGTVAPSGFEGSLLAPVGVGWLAAVLGAVTLGCLGLLWVGWRTFFNLSGDFAEQV